MEATQANRPAEKPLDKIFFSGFQTTGKGDTLRAVAEAASPYEAIMGKFPVTQEVAAKNPKKAEMVGQLESRIILNKIIDGVSAKHITLVIKPDKDGNEIRVGEKTKYKFYRGENENLVMKANLYLGTDKRPPRLVVDIFEKELASKSEAPLKESEEEAAIET